MVEEGKRIFDLMLFGGRDGGVQLMTKFAEVVLVQEMDGVDSETLPLEVGMEGREC